MDEPASFGYWVRRRRKALDLTQGDLARRVGCAEVTIQKIEADERRPSGQIAVLLAEQLQIPPDEQAVFLSAARGELMTERGPASATATRPSSREARTSAPPHNLPSALTSFVGRTRELATTAAMLAETRLLTLTGPGGSGKTRLALELATSVREQFPDGVWLIELAPLAEGALIVPAIAALLQVREDPGRPLLSTLITHLRAKEMLLLLDNCEHLIDACAQVSTTLLQACPRLRLLASSREPLGVAGEAFFRVPALATPDPHQLPPLDQLAGYEAIQLFVARAGAVQPTFELTAITAAPLAEICARLDGIPLAIELAAARTRVLTIEQIAVRLDDRFRLLTGGSRTALPRHQALRALIDWSYDLLTDEERVLLHRLAVFVGGWTLEAAESVCGDKDEDGSMRDEEQPVHPAPCIVDSSGVLDLLTHLVDKSLVLVEEHDGAMRYRRLETIRQYALEKLAASGEADDVRRRHMAYYLALAEEHNSLLPHRDWVAQMEIEHDNLRAALTWCQSAEGGAELGLRLTVALIDFWISNGYWSEARTWLEAALAHPDAGRAEHTWLRGAALHGLGFMSALQGDYAAGQAYLADSLKLAQQFENHPARAWLLFRLGWLAREQGDSVMACLHLEESLTLFRELGDDKAVAWGLVTLAEVAVMQEDATWATTLLDEGLALFQAENVPEGIAWALNHLGHVAQIESKYQQALRFHNESLPLFRESGVQNLGDLGLAWGFHGLGETALAQGNIILAANHLTAALALFRGLGDRSGIAWCLAGLGSAAALDEEPERAARLWGAAERLRVALGCRPAPAARATYERAVALARAQLGDEAFAAAWAAGAALSLDEAIAEALGSGD